MGSSRQNLQDFMPLPNQQGQVGPDTVGWMATLVSHLVDSIASSERHPKGAAAEPPWANTGGATNETVDKPTSSADF